MSVTITKYIKYILKLATTVIQRRVRCDVKLICILSLLDNVFIAITLIDNEYWLRPHPLHFETKGKHSFLYHVHATGSCLWLGIDGTAVGADLHINFKLPSYFQANRLCRIIQFFLLSHNFGIYCKVFDSEYSCKVFDGEYSWPSYKWTIFNPPILQLPDAQVWRSRYFLPMACGKYSSELSTLSPHIFSL